MAEMRRVARASRRARWWRTARLVAIVLCVPSAAATQSMTLDRILAVVAGRAILQSDLAAVVEFELERADETGDPMAALLERLIDRELILSEVERYVRAAASQAIVEARFQAVRGRYDSAQDFDTALEQLGLDVVQLRNRIRDDLRIEAYLEQRFGSTARPTDEAVLRYYRENRATFVRNDGIVPLAEVESAVRDRLAEEQRLALIAEWTLQLRRRATIIRPELVQP